jgi:hypothetical protein
MRLLLVAPAKASKTDARHIKERSDKARATIHFYLRMKYKNQRKSKALVPVVSARFPNCFSASQMDADRP